MANPVLLYREDSNDSMCAVWVYRQQVCSYYCECVPIQRNEPAPNVQDREVLIFDFSYERPILELMRQQAHSLRVFTHHEEDEENLFGLDGVYFDREKSAARLTWDWWIEQQPAHERQRYDRPWLVDYTEDAELRRWDKHGSAEVNTALLSYPRTFETWTRSLNATQRIWPTRASTCSGSAIASCVRRSTTP